MFWEWWFAVWQVALPGGITYAGVAIPVWSIAITMGTPIAWLWIRDRRRAPGLCLNCGYDLRGTDHAACPECGDQKAPR